MRWIRILWLRFRSLARRRSVDGELDDELRFHLYSEIERKIASGMDAEEARAETLRSFGGLTQQKEACRDMRYTGGMLRRSRSFAAVAILSLALGIGAVLVMSRLVSSLLYGITPHDPLALLLAVLILAAVAALASLLPALRASRIDPMTALRYE